jgi:hypothetical protein
VIRVLPRSREFVVNRHQLRSLHDQIPLPLWHSAYHHIGFVFDVLLECAKKVLFGPGSAVAVKLVKKKAQEAGVSRKLLSKMKIMIFQPFARGRRILPRTLKMENKAAIVQGCRSGVYWSAL